MDSQVLKRMQKLESENSRLKKLLADKSIDYDIFKRRLRTAKKVVAPSVQRAMVIEILGKENHSMKRACRVLGQRRPSIYDVPKQLNESTAIELKLVDLKQRYANSGFGLMYSKLRLEGFRWGRNRVSKHYKSLNLNLRSPKKRPKIKRDNPDTIASKVVNGGCSLDFLSDEVACEKTVRKLNIMDESSGSAS